MSTVDASGAVHGSDGKFAGHVAAESDSSVMLTSAAEAQPDHDQYGPLRGDLDRVIAQQFAHLSTAQLRAKIEQIKTANSDDPTYELNRRLATTGQSFRWVREGRREKIEIYTQGEPGKPYYVPAGQPVPTERTEVVRRFNEAASKAARGESFTDSDAADVARYHATYGLRDFADGKPVLSAELKHATRWLRNHRVEQPELDAFDAWVDSKNPHPQVPQT
ncbi:hypothetical protein ATK17_1793 [Branchiibius hedensis]|uniref:Uncharacterized protein n=2 Tax=Branchiibius TaxID=908251 RepID=A0A2Y8ZQ54_9MICO|nr:MULTISPECIES: hypothetical protein [Branchiibius]KYH44761.1 hypothetical protein AZH51_12100 [Branchiibius sp. NY16-3462-2]PWJ25657.1 hypothetical protein ATK17_1793 [Branchiibius hedensis]SSA34470.1 hypothetical protein SAMN04489750_1793 [Branchiibius hedensis]